MPVSPFRRAVEEGLTEPEGSSSSGKKAKGKSRPTSARRNKRQKTKERYSKAREDAQLEGIIPTTPEGAVKPEKVPESAQTNQPLPGLTEQAIRKGWAVPEGSKPGLVDELIKIVDDSEMPAKAKIAAFNALRLADEAQYERDHPEEVAKRGKAVAGGGSTNIGSITIQSNIQAAHLIREMIQNGQLGLGGGEEVRTLALPGALGDSGQPGEVATGTTPDSDQQGIG